MAALLDGRHAAGLDQTGLSQKAGPVVSDVHITRSPHADGLAPASTMVDVLLGFDLLGAAESRSLHVSDPARTVAVVSDHVTPTAQMVVAVDAPAPDRASARAAIDRVTRAEDNVYLDAQRIAERLLGDATQANVVVLGAAWQRGALPVSIEALREAFRLNGVSVERNLAALEWGRAWVADPGLVEAASNVRGVTAQLTPRARALVDAVAPASGELRRLLEIRVPDLVGWGGERAAKGYTEAIARVRAVEGERIAGSTALTEEVARGLHKLTAYKDEYEVARLHIEGLSALPPGARYRFHLHPPILRALGMRRKIALGRWFVPVLRLLRHGRRLRGTMLDPFGRTRVRRAERALPGEYLALVDLALTRLSPETLDDALEIAALPELVRGYEEIKLAGVERFRTRGAELAQRLR
jgi:indolepyruvate ferredoxin oxidoreductase